MPVTARLSKRLYDTLGEDVAQELVDWFNQVDATYRGDLRELNELNFSRFDAKLEQRTVELRALIDRRCSALQAAIDRRYSELDAKLDRGYGALDAKIDQRCGELEVRFRADVQRLEERMVSGFAEAEARMGKQLAGVRAELIKWMFVIVVGTGLGAVAAMNQLVR